jgi:D-3-phosphoglycerate dehydrogenase
MRRANWNIQEMSNRIFEGSKAAVASIRFDGPFNREVVERIEESDDVFAVSVNEI